MVEDGRPRSAGRLLTHSPIAGLHRRRLSFLEVLAQSVSVLAPSAVMVVVPSIVLAESGGATVPAFVAATALVLLVGWCLTHFGRRMAAVGGIYSYTAKGLGPVPALIGGWSLIIGYGAVAMSTLVGSALYLAGLLGLDPTPTVIAGLAVVLGLIATLCAIRGIQLTARLALALEVLSIMLALLVLFVLLLALRGGSGTAAGPAVDGTAHWSGLAVGIVLAVTAFVGFEGAATLGVEARRPLITVPRAMLWTPAVAGALFLTAAAIQVVVLRSAPAEVLNSPVPVAELADRNGLGVLRRLLDLGVAAASFACVTGSTNALGRILFTMGRETILPPVIGQGHRRFGTPAIALVLVLPVIVGVPVVALAAGASPRAVLTGALTVSAFGYVLAYVLACLAMPAFLRRIGELTVLPAIGGLLAAAVSLVVLGGALLGAWWSGAHALAAVFVLALLPGPAWAGWLRWKEPDRLMKVGMYDQATAGSVLPGSVSVERLR